MTIAQMKYKSTDYQARPQPLRVCTTPEEARAAALSSVTVTCLDCSTTWPGEVIPKHECRDATGRDLGPMKRARAEGARRAIEEMKNFPIPPCANCGRTDMKPGEQHNCSLRQTPLPHEAAAAEFQRQGAAHLAAQVQGGRS